MLFAVVPTIAEQLGFDVAATDRTLLPAMEQSSETAARVVRDRVLVEPTHWFIPPETTPALRDVAAAVWEAREAVLTYRGEPVRVRPLGLILKGDKWYLLAGAGLSDGRRYRLFRMSRVADVELSDHRFDRPVDFDLARAWTAHREAFLASLAEYFVEVRINPTAEPLLAFLDEAKVPVPLPADTERDDEGWALLRLRFERPDTAVRHLLRLGADAEVLHPPELRQRMVQVAAEVSALYRRPGTISGSSKD